MSKNETRRNRIRKTVANRNRTVCSSRFDTSDIIQETELQLWKSGIDNFESDYSDVDQALLATIAKGNLAKKIRDHRRQKRDSACDRPFTASIASQSPSPNEQAEYQELSELILAVTSKMSKLDQRIYFLRFHCSKSTLEVSNEVGLTVRQIQHRIQTIKRRIQMHIEALE